MLNLKMVTWKGDLTQFIVDAYDDSSAIKKAIEANLMFDYCDEELLQDINDPTTYIVENIDFALLAEIFKRNDVIGLYGEAVVFND